MPIEVHAARPTSVNSDGLGRPLEAVTVDSDDFVRTLEVLIVVNTDQPAPAASISDLPVPTYVAHRGGSPEHTLAAYRRTQVQANIAAHAGVRATVSGTLVLNWDSTVDRTWVTGTGAVNTKSDAEWQAGVVEDVDGVLPDEADAPAAFWSEFITEFGGQTVVFAEWLAGGTGYAALINDIVARNLQASVVFMSPDRVACNAAAAAGLFTVYRFTTAPTTTELASLAASNIWGCTMSPANSTAANITAAHTAGLKHFTRLVNNTSEDDAYVTAGTDGIFTDFPLELSGPTPPPPPPSGATRIGACPDGSNSASVITKYGTGASIRSFSPPSSSATWAVPARPNGASHVHHSWKPNTLALITDAAIIAAVVNLRDGDCVEIWHESDVKYRSSDIAHGQPTALATLQYRMQMKTDFHERIVRLRAAGTIPFLRTVNTWAGWAVDTTSNVNPSNPSIHCGADLLGIDMDGIPANDNFYDYVTRQLRSPKLATAMTVGGYSGWIVPEFCMPSVASDPTRARRIAWFQNQVAVIEQGYAPGNIPSPVAINWFDTTGIIGAAEKLDQPAEITAWSNLVASHAP